MNMLSPLTPTAPPVESLQADFLTMLPKIVASARFGFRDLACAHRRADAVAEVVALAWKWYVRLAQLGRRERAYPTALADFAVKQVRCGRGVAGQPKAKDVLNPSAQRRHGFRVEPLPCLRGAYAEGFHVPAAQRHLDALEEQLGPNTVTPVDDQVAFKLDFGAWLRTRTARDRKLLRAMARGERTQDLAVKFRVSPARVSQKRREFHAAWRRFLGGDEDPSDGTGGRRSRSRRVPHGG